MERQANALSWILKKSDSLNVSIETLSWIRELFPDWTDIYCSLSIDGRRVDGWGAAVGEDLALCKAFAEAMERAVLIQNSFSTSNGLAAHLNREEARANASSELVERDLFLCHFLTKTPFKPIELGHESWGWLPQVYKWASSYGIEVRFFHLESIGVVSAVSGFNAPLPFGYVIGSSAKPNLEEASQSALIEAARRAIRFIERARPTDAISLETFRAIQSPSFSDHGRLALNLEYAASLSPLFNTDEMNTSQAHASESHISSDEIQIDDVMWTRSESDDCPFVFARATSLRAQNLWVGPTTPQLLNFDRLSQFVGRPLEWKDLNLFPHPFD